MSHNELDQQLGDQFAAAESETGQAVREQLLSRLIVGQTVAVALLSLMTGIGGWLMPGSGLLALLPLGLIAMLVGVLSYWLLKRSRFYPAGYLFLLGTVAAITVNVFIRGYQDASGIYYLWPILAAVTILETRGGILVTLVSAILYLILVVAQEFGYQTPLLPYDPQGEALLTVGSRVLMFFLLAFLAWLSARGLNQALGVARQAAQRWRDLNETLEQRVADRTQDLERRAVQLATAAGVGRAAASILELETLAREVVDQVRDRFDLYYVGLFLLDDAGQYAVLEAGTGEAGRTMKEEGHKLEVGGESMVGAACAEGQARIALDVAGARPGDELVRFDNPLLPDTHSEMALPLVVGDRVLGALDVQSAQPAAFSEEDIAVLQLVADQVAVAVDNARKFLEEAELLEATSPLFRVSQRLPAATTTDEVAQAIIAVVAETEADGCAVGRLGASPDGQVETMTFLAGWSRRGESRFPIGAPMPVDASPIPADLVSTFWAVEDISHDTRLPEPTRRFLAQFGRRAYINVPLQAGGQVIGFVIVLRETPGGPGTPGAFSEESIQLYQALADQAAVALERARLLEETQRRAAREQLIGAITDDIRTAVTIEDAIQRAISEMGRALGATEVVARIGTERDLLSAQGGDGHE